VILSFIFLSLNGIGWYFLFFKGNRPISRWRSISLMIAIIILFPLINISLGELHNHLQTPPTMLSVFTVISLLFMFAIFILLGAEWKKMLVPAAFCSCIMYAAMMPVTYFLVVILEPMLNVPSLYEVPDQYPLIGYANVFLTSLITNSINIFAWRCLRKTNFNPPFKIYFPFCLMYIISAFIIPVLWNTVLILTVKSFLFFGLFGIYLLVVQVLLFYLYIKLIPNRSIMALCVKEPDNYEKFIEHLSKRELELIKMVLNGETRHKDISDSLNISVNTVKSHLKNIYQVTGVSNIAGLVMLFQGYKDKSPKPPQ